VQARPSWDEIWINLEARSGVALCGLRLLRELIEESLEMLGNRSLQDILISAREGLPQNPVHLSLREFEVTWDSCLIKMLKWIVHRPHKGLSIAASGIILIT
jgi:hypothetical protein